MKSLQTWVLRAAVFAVVAGCALLARGQDNQQPVLQLQIGHGAMSRVAYSASPTGALVASVDANVIKLWETQDGHLLCTLDVGTNPAMVDAAGRAVVAWSADGLQLLSPAGAGEAGGYWRWDVRRCGQRERLQDLPVAMAMPPSAPAIVSAGDRRSRPRADTSRSVVASSADGRWLLLGNDFGGPPHRVLERDSGRETPLADFSGFEDVQLDKSVYPLPHVAVFSASGRWLAVKSNRDKLLRIYDTRGRALVASTAVTFVPSAGQTAEKISAVLYEAEQRRAGVSALGFSSDESQLYVYRDSGVGDALRRQWLEVRDLKTLSVVRQTPGVRRGSLPRDSRMQVIARSGEDLVLVPLHGTTGGSLAAIRVQPQALTTALWRMDAGAPIASVAYGAQAWFSQSWGGGADGRNGADLPTASPDDTASAAEVQRFVASRNRAFQSTVDAWNGEQGSSTRVVEDNTFQPGLQAGAFSPDGRYHALWSRRFIDTKTPIANSVSLWDTQTGQRLWQVDTAGYGGAMASPLAVSAVGRYVALWTRASNGNDQFRLLDGKTGAVMSTTSYDFKSVKLKAMFSDDASVLYFRDDLRMTGAIDLKDPKAPALIWSNQNRCQCAPLGFLPRAGRLLMPPLPDQVAKEPSDYLRDIYSGWKQVLHLPVPQGRGMAVSNAAETMVAVAQQRSIRLVALGPAPGLQPRLLAQLNDITSAVTDLAFSPDGQRLIAGDDQGGLWLWDVAKARLLARMHAFADGSWVVIDSEGRFDTNDIQAINRLYWVVPDEPLRVYPLELFMRDYFQPQLLPRLLAGAALPKVPDLKGINRAQPAVAIVSAQPALGSTGRVDVTVRVQATRGAQGRNSGAADLRLFRAGQLVARASLADAASVAQLGSGKDLLVRFPGVQLPAGAQQLNFSAYAFNSDRVKSATATYAWARPAAAPVAQAAPARRAYVVSVGINQHDQPAWNLSYAANDAQRTQEVLSQHLRDSKAYTQVVAVPLISDEGRAHARKATLRAVLGVLAGQPRDAIALQGVPQADALQAATPDDVVIVTFSGHGYAEGGEFFLVPQDIGGGRNVDAATQQRSISTQELALWMSDIDAGQLTLIVDACQSAAAVEAGGFKPGPMGAKGLGQLAYDKGMRVLAGTQADNVALESGSLRHGLLTFALIQEGLGMGKADTKPVDRRIDLGEWLNYGVDRVPAIYSDVHAGRRVIDGAAARQKWSFALRATTALESEKAVVQLKVQRPTLFDFNRSAEQALVSALP